jgi:hypothetical protein
MEPFSEYRTNLFLRRESFEAIDLHSRIHALAQCVEHLQIRGFGGNIEKGSECQFGSGKPCMEKTKI